MSKGFFDRLADAVVRRTERKLKEKEERQRERDIKEIDQINEKRQKESAKSSG